MIVKTEVTGLVPGPKDDSKSWKEMEDGEQKRAAFLRENAAFLREMKLPPHPAPASRIARSTKVVVAANFLLLAIIVVGFLLCAGK